MIVFDIETEPLPEVQLRAIYTPLDESQIDGLVTGEFDPSSVKLGNLKDQAKIDAKIQDARFAHESAKANAAQIVAEAKRRHWEKFVEVSTLSAVTSKVCAIGYHAPHKGKTIIHGDMEESKILYAFWSQYQTCRRESRSMIGVNIHGFDLPYLLRRSWILQVDVPETVLNRSRYWDDVFVDLCLVWLAGQRFGSGESASFESLARAFGTPGKQGEDGAMFHHLWKTDRDRAIRYLQSDVEQPAVWAGRMGIVQ